MRGQSPASLVSGVCRVGWVRMPRAWACAMGPPLRPQGMMNRPSPCRRGGPSAGRRGSVPAPKKGPRSHLASLARASLSSAWRSPTTTCDAATWPRSALRRACGGKGRGGRERLWHRAALSTAASPGRARAVAAAKAARCCRHAQARDGLGCTGAARACMSSLSSSSSGGSRDSACVCALARERVRGCRFGRADGCTFQPC